jgi:hypothetical protein
MSDYFIFRIVSIPNYVLTLIRQLEYHKLIDFKGIRSQHLKISALHFYYSFLRFFRESSILTFFKGFIFNFNVL